jgi:hypothetical protein
MKFEPKSEKEIQEGRLIPDGVYDFDVLDATDGVTKTGKDMIALKLRVYLNNGNALEMKDWLVADDTMAWKLRKFAESIGLLESYEAGELIADDLPGRSGKLQVGHKDDPEFGPQNRVKGYGEPKQKASSGKSSDLAVGGKRRPKPSVEPEDDCPF